MKSTVQLQPSKNSGCLSKARRELIAQRKARDLMLELLSLNLASGGSCKPEGASSTRPDPWARLEEMGGREQPLLLSAWRATRRWLRNSMRALRAKVVRHSPWLVVAGALAIQVAAVLHIL